MTVLLLTDAAMEQHDTGAGHPERRERLAAASAGVADGAVAAGAALRVEVPPEATDPEITRVHGQAHLATVMRAAELRAWLDSDTAVGAGSIRAARLAAGATARAADAIRRGECTVAFAVVRPPGHHASRDVAAGFCLFNNVAIAIESLRAHAAADGVPLRAAILDWDVHHGDGTQAIYESDPDVFYASTHEGGIYPGTGAVADSGSGAATGTKRNRPLTAGDGDDAFVRAWTEELLPEAERFAPTALLVSAGYDAHRDDPLARLAVTEVGYRAVAEAVGALAARRGLAGVALTLEGGYDLDALRASVAATVTGLLAGLAST